MDSTHRRNMIIATLRRASYRWPPRYQVLNAAKETYYEGNRKRTRFKCACCGKWYNRKEVAVDHIIPVVPLAGFDSWDGYLERLFCEVEGLQVLCKGCHAAKSKGEVHERAAERKRRKSAEGNEAAEKPAPPVPDAGDAPVRPRGRRTGRKGEGKG